MKPAIAVLTASLCLLVAAVALGGARVPATISLKLGPDVGLFKGKVKSDDIACFENRKVRIVRVSGQDIRVGKGFTNVNGHYAIQTTESSGDWIAKVKHEDIDGVQCKGAQSEIRSAG
ncbi:MAG: hypothetical protein QOI10_2214 [Solirubrobacterales bacterium]|jgi:hypothetical protein|nr:hypothetical protein [Solirubrobacterales bacterium]